MPSSMRTSCSGDGVISSYSENPLSHTLNTTALIPAAGVMSTTCRCITPRATPTRILPKPSRYGFNAVPRGASDTGAGPHSKNCNTSTL